MKWERQARRESQDEEWNPEKNLKNSMSIRNANLTTQRFELGTKVMVAQCLANELLGWLLTISREKCLPELGLKAWTYCSVQACYQSQVPVQAKISP